MTVYFVQPGGSFQSLSPVYSVSSSFYEDRLESAVQKITDNYLLSPADMEKHGFPYRIGANNYAFYNHAWRDSPKPHCRSGEVQCSRCTQPFRPRHQRPDTACIYHADRFDWKTNEYMCCGQPKTGEGCSWNPYHVWTGTYSGWNGPFSQYHGYKETLFAPPVQTHRAQVFALDCEMCFTVNGMELTKVSVVDIEGTLVYESLVRPMVPIIDYNTQFSGITADMLNSPRAQRLHQVQLELLSFIDADSILVGHALHNDLRALKLVHQRVVDTSIVYSHPEGLPFRYSLKNLMKRIFNEDVQSSGYGHCSIEDSRNSMELLMHRVINDQ